MEVELIIKKLNLDPYTQVKKRIRGLPGFNIQELIFALINSASMEEASTWLGYGEGAIKTATRATLGKIFTDRSAKFGEGKQNPTWRFTLLKLIEYKHCNSCDRNLPFSKFYSHVGTDSTNLSSECSSCHTYRTKLQKIDIKNRTPRWANLSLIKEFYNKCPEGYHVDHIIPLRGEIVSGFHVIENLQYLFAEDNLKKSNKWG